MSVCCWITHLLKLKCFAELYRSSLEESAPNLQQTVPLKRPRERLLIRNNHRRVIWKRLPSGGLRFPNIQVSNDFRGRWTRAFPFRINNFYFYYNSFFTVIHFVGVCIYAAWVHEESLTSLAPLSAIPVKQICHEVCICFSKPKNIIGKLVFRMNGFWIR